VPSVPRAALMAGHGVSNQEACGKTRTPKASTLTPRRAFLAQVFDNTNTEPLLLFNDWCDTYESPPTPQLP